MRVISGTKKGFRLAAGSGDCIRPTTDRAKQIVFDIIGARIRKAVILDVFAGSGSLGIEALSRGAHNAVFIESDRYARSVLRKNLQKTGFESQATVISATAARALESLARSAFKFNFIFADPPYRQSLAKPTILAVEENDLLQSEGWLILEHGAQESLDVSSAHLHLFRQKKQGESVVSFYEHV